MQRRGFIRLLGGAAAWPLAARAQQDTKDGRIARIGILLADGTPESSARSDVLVKAFADLGYVEGTTAQLILRLPKTRADLAIFARELIEKKVDVIVSVSSLGAYKAKQLTSSVPIVFVYSSDPVGIGLVESLVHPGGNVTGLSLMGGDLVAKRLALLREAVPMMSRVTFLFDPETLYTELPAQQDAAKVLGLQLRPIAHADAGCHRPGVCRAWQRRHRGRDGRDPTDDDPGKRPDRCGSAGAWNTDGGISSRDGAGWSAVVLWTGL